MHGDGRQRCPRCGTLIRKDGLATHMSTLSCQVQAESSSYRGPEPSISYHMDSFDYLTAWKSLVEDNLPTNDLLLPVVLGNHDHPASPTYDTILPTEDRIKYRNALPMIPDLNTSTDTAQDLKYRSIGEPKSRVPLINYSQLAPNSPECVYQNPELDNTLIDLEEIGHLIWEVSKWGDATWSNTTRDLSYRSAIAGIDIESTIIHQMAHQNSIIGKFLHHGARKACRNIGAMKFGGKCALCTETLGVTSKSVFEHGRHHVHAHGAAVFRCPTCDVAFSYQSDLDFHKRIAIGTDGFQTCVDYNSYEGDDWMAQASNQDRQAFIHGLRRWETLQLQWYLAKADRFLRRKRPRQEYNAVSDMKPTGQTVCGRFALLATHSERPQSSMGSANVADLVRKFARSTQRDDSEMSFHLEEGTKIETGGTNIHVYGDQKIELASDPLNPGSMKLVVGSLDSERQS